jgi:hypothetical protein
VIIPGILEPLGVPIVIVSVHPVGKPVLEIMTEFIAHDPVFVSVIGMVFVPICSCPHNIAVPLVQGCPLIVIDALAPTGAIADCGML